MVYTVLSSTLTKYIIVHYYVYTVLSSTLTKYIIVHYYVYTVRLINSMCVI